MENTLSFFFMRLVQRFFMLMTGICLASFVFYLLFKNHQEIIVDNDGVGTTQNIRAILSEENFDLNPDTSLADSQSRDIFSLSPDNNASVSAVPAPHGELPSNIKIVGLLVAHPSQIILEDSLTNKTYFINEGDTQDGVRIVKSSHDQMTINYQGQDINVPIHKN